ncbi:MAG: pyridoxal kinase PdxY [Micropruina sp.]
MTTILSIQSSVAYGHVGNSAATFPLMRAGIEVWPVLTVHFSNHTGYGQWRGPLLTAADVTDVITGIDERGVLPRVDAVLSGYQGAEDVGGAILAAVDLVKQRSPRAIYCCDPVMGDVGRGFFVRPGIPEFMRDRVVPQAQIVTPNHFELDFLTGRETHTLDEVIEAAHALRAVGPETVLVTSVVTDTTGDDSLTMLAVTGAGAWQVTTPASTGCSPGRATSPRPCSWRTGCAPGRPPRPSARPPTSCTRCSSRPPSRACRSCSWWRRRTRSSHPPITSTCTRCAEPASSRARP